MLTTHIAEILLTQRTVTASDIVAYSGCEMRAAHDAIAQMSGLVRVRRGVYARAPGVTLRTAGRLDELLGHLPATSEVLRYEMGCSVKSVYHAIRRLREDGFAIVRDAKGVYDVREQPGA